MRMLSRVRFRLHPNGLELGLFPWSPPNQFRNIFLQKGLICQYEPISLYIDLHGLKVCIMYLSSKTQKYSQLPRICSAETNMVTLLMFKFLNTGLHYNRMESPKIVIGRYSLYNLIVSPSRLPSIWIPTVTAPTRLTVVHHCIEQGFVRSTKLSLFEGVRISLTRATRLQNKYLHYPNKMIGHWNKAK